MGRGNQEVRGGEGCVGPKLCDREGKLAPWGGEGKRGIRGDVAMGCEGMLSPVMR